jgi:hypothetical protein
MRTADEETWEAEQWDEYLDEFGPEGYIEARYGREALAHLEVTSWTKEVGNERPVTDVPNAA